MVSREQFVEDGFSLGSPASRRELVPYHAVHGVVPHVQPRQRDKAARRL